MTDQNIETMQWSVDYDNPELGLYSHHDLALEIVSWVNANGGEAHYWPDSGDPHHDSPPIIRVRTATGWAYAAPGDTVRMNDEWFATGMWADDEPEEILVFTVERPS